MSVPLALAAVLIEAVAGYPQAIYGWISHPVTWIGALIAWLERRLNKAAEPFGVRRAKGVLALAVLLAVVATVTLGLQIALDALLGTAGWWLVAIGASSLIAQRSLDNHVAAVADALDQGGLDAGRKAVAMIVGRDPASLDEAGVARAAIESLAENFSDGIVAPVLWLAVGGLPGVALYKAINTADSMVGHKSERYLAFGWASARLDDLVNLPASRLAALWLTLAAMLMPGASAGNAHAIVKRDATHHRSPNAGWPEAAMAGALGFKLAGPRRYGGEMVDDHWIGDGRRDLCADDIRAALRLYRTACVMQVAVLALIAGVVALIPRLP